MATSRAICLIPRRSATWMWIVTASFSASTAGNAECWMQAADVVGKHCADLVPEAERGRFREQILRRMSRREQVRPDGSKVCLEVHEQFLRTARGAVVGLRMAAIDVTERKKSENAAYQTATELRALFQAFLDLFLRLNRDGSVLDAKGGQRWDPFLAPEKFAGHNLNEILPDAVLAQIRQAEEEVRNSNAMQIGEFTATGGPARRATKCACCR